MGNYIVQFVILFVIVGINYGCQKLIQHNPEMISGFHWGETDEEKEKDRAWLKLLSRCMAIANLITMAGGVLSIIFHSPLFYFLSLALPVTIAMIYAYSKRTGSKGQTFTTSKIVSIVSVIVVLLLIPVVYSYQRDLEVSITQNGMGIGGMYGEELTWQEITEVSMSNTLPSIDRKTNGFSLGAVKLGNFKTTDGQSIKLFTHSAENHIRLVKTDNMVYYLSCKNKDATDKLFADIQQKISSTSK